jgi:hypothetical protein
MTLRHQSRPGVKSLVHRFELYANQTTTTHIENDNFNALPLAAMPGNTCHLVVAL